MAVEFRHEALAETHDLAIAAALAGGVGALLRVEVRTSLAAAHREGREGVLEDLLEGEELEDREVHRRIEAETALVRPDRRVHLNAVAAVHAHGARVVHPRHAEHDHALRLHHALQNGFFLVGLVRVDDGGEGGQHLVNGLEEFRLVGILRLDVFENRFDVCVHVYPF